MKEINQGDVCFVDLSKDCVGSEQGMVRPCLIITSDTTNLFSPIVIVVPITSKRKKERSTHYILKKSKYPFLSYKINTVLTENVRSISKGRIERKIGSIEQEDIEKIINKLNNNFT